jgi:hypothetical protein
VFMNGVLPLYVEQYHMMKLESEDLQRSVNAFNQKVLALCVHSLKQLEQPLPVGIMKHLYRLFLADPKCSHFFDTYGGIFPSDPRAARAEGRKTTVAYC